MAKAFEGIRVLDFTQVLAGPFATQQLALQGADVIKIEEPTAGDQTRALAGAGPGATGMTPTFLTCNVGKRSMTLNLKHDRAKEVVETLVRSADVLVENFRPGVMERLGFDANTCLGWKPDLIYCSISGYGQAGPKSKVAAYDGAIQADSGMMEVTGTLDSGPLRTGYMHVDMSTALNAAFAISSALFRRAQTGEGQRLDVAMMDTAVVLQAVQYAGYLAEGEQPERIGNRSPTGQPTANVFATEDGYLQVLALRQGQVEKLFAAIECSERLNEPAFQTPDARVLNYDTVSRVVSERLRSRSSVEWYEVLREAGVPVAEIRDFAAVHADPQFAHRNAFIEMDSRLEAGKTDTLIGTGYIASPDSPGTEIAAPRLGEHTDEILQQAGLPPSTIAELRSAGAL